MKPYTPQQFLDDIRHWLVMHKFDVLTHKQWKHLAQVGITYKPKPTGEASLRQWNDPFGRLLGSSERDGSHSYIFGGKMSHNQTILAQTMIHELAHDLCSHERAQQHHTPAWARTARDLGVEEHASHYDPYNNMDMNTQTYSDGKFGPAELPWTDPELAAYVRSLPPVDWTETDNAIAT